MRERRPPLPKLTEEQVRAILFIAAHRHKHGCGPTWSEVGSVMGWSVREREERIRALYPHGVRWRSGVERSLTVKQWGVTRALMAARSLKEAQA